MTNKKQPEADLPTERFFTVVYKLTDVNTAKYLSNRDWVTYVYADSMAELASLKELSAEPAGAVYAELPNSLRTSDISGDPSDRHWASGYYNADHMRDFADRTHALRIASLSANAGGEPVAEVVPCHTPSGKRVALRSEAQGLPIGTKLYTHPSPPEGMAAEQALLKVLAAVQRYLSPDGPSAHDTLTEIIEVVDPWPLGQLDKS